MLQVEKLAIIGSRDFTDYAIVKNTVLARFDWAVLKEIVSGGASGVDSLAGMFAVELGVKMTVLPVDWARYGRSAGPFAIVKLWIMRIASSHLRSQRRVARQMRLRIVQKKGKPHDVVYVK